MLLRLQRQPSANVDEIPDVADDVDADGHVDEHDELRLPKIEDFAEDEDVVAIMQHADVARVPDALDDALNLIPKVYFEVGRL